MANPNGVEKDKRYDRQLRIWGAHGQQRVEACKIALLNCGPTGSETLKNLVLGGIAGFTIIDGAKVSAGDLGNNFFVEASSLGEPRARVVTRLLTELNESVAGSYVEENPETLLAGNPNFFKDFDMVIATQMREAELIILDDICRQYKRHLLVVRSYGLVGYVRPSLPEHQVIESKPDSGLDDLRLNAPFPELRELALSFNLESLDDMTFAHIPFAILLIQAAEKWKLGGEDGTPRPFPSKSGERADFKELINSMRRVTNEIPLDSENFDEALKAAYQVWTPYVVPSEIKTLMADEAAAVAPDSDTFWILVLYLKIQRVYKEKAEQDVCAVEAHVNAILTRLGLAASLIPLSTIRLFCKNARALRVVRYRPLKFEAAGSGRRDSRGASLQKDLSAEGSQLADVSFGVLLLAVDRFYATYSRYPGTADHLLEEDVPALKGVANQILSEHGVTGCIADDYVVEVCRFGAGELHVVAALMGGVAAQEAIKLITQQFLPVSGAFIYNGVSSTTSVFDWL
eukprot:gene20768-27592_t